MEASVGKADDVYRVADLDNIDLTKENFKLKTDLRKYSMNSQLSNCSANFSKANAGLL